MKIFIPTSFVGFLLMFSACVSTDVLDSPDDGKVSENIVLDLMSEDRASTKAHDGFTLRYVAKIYQKDGNNWGSAPYDRKEILEGGTNKIIFSVPANNSYKIILFADYIPSGSEKTGECYRDYYYNTVNPLQTTNQRFVGIRTNPGDDSQTLSPEFFNNDNYDCFFASTEVYKDQNELVEKITLKRLCAKVYIQDISPNSGECEVTVSKLGVNPRYDYDNNTTTTTPSSTFDTQRFNTLLSDKVNVTADNKELLYFYTLAYDQSSTVGIEINVNNAGKTKSTKITQIPVRQNYKTIVTGEFVDASPVSDIPGIGDQDPQEGDIILDLSVDDNWIQTPLAS